MDLNSEIKILNNIVEDRRMDALKKEHPERCKTVYAVEVTQIIKIHIQRVSLVDHHFEHYKDITEKRNKILEEIIRWSNGAHKLCNDPVLHGYKCEGWKKEPISAYLTATFSTFKEALEARNEKFPQLKEVYRRLRISKIVLLIWLSVLLIIVMSHIVSWIFLVLYLVFIIPVIISTHSE